MCASLTNVSSQFLSSKGIQVAAIFEDKDEATKAAESLASETVVNDSDINVLTPDHTALSKSLESDSRRIGKRLLNSHIAMGIAGLLIGLLIALLLVLIGPQLTQQNPVFTFIALISPGLFIGMFVAGLFGLRPDRTQLIETVRHALKQNRTALIVSLSNAETMESAKAILSKHTSTIATALK